MLNILTPIDLFLWRHWTSDTSSLQTAIAPWILMEILLMIIFEKIIKIYQSDLRFKGSSDPNHFIFEIYGGKSRIRHTTTLN